MANTKHVKKLQDLIQIAKECKLVKLMWGKQVRTSNVIVTTEDDKDRTMIGQGCIRSAK